MYFTLSTFQLNKADEDKDGNNFIRRKVASADQMRMLFVDLDLFDPERHSTDRPSTDPKIEARRKPNPTQDQVQTLLATLPQATAAFHTGGGLHLYWTLAEPIDAPSETATRLRDSLRRALLVELTEKLGRHADVGPTTDPARIGRVPGSLNRKASPVDVYPVQDAGPQYDAEQLLATLEELYPRPQPKVAQRNRVAGAAGAMSLGGGDNKYEGSAVTRFAQTVDPGFVLEIAHAAQMLTEDSGNFPREDGSYGDMPSFEIKRDTIEGKDRDRVVFYGDRWLNEVVADGLLDDPYERHEAMNAKRLAAEKPATSMTFPQLDSAQLLSVAVAPRDWKKLRNFIEAIDTPDGFDLDLLEELVNMELADREAVLEEKRMEKTKVEQEARAAEQAAVQAELDQAVAEQQAAAANAERREDAEAVDPSKLSFAEALARGVRASEDLTKYGARAGYLICDPGDPQHGFHYSRPIDSTATPTIPFIAFRERREMVMRIDEEFNAEPIKTKKGAEVGRHDVRVVRRDGRQKLMADLDSDTALNPGTFLDALDFGIAKGFSGAELLQLRDMLSVAQYGLLEQQEHTGYTSCGWLKTEAGYTYIAPAGAIAARGAVEGFDVRDIGESGAEIQDSRTFIGLPSCPAHDDAANARRLGEALRVLQTVAKPEMLLSTVGHVLAGFSPLDHQGSLALVGAPNSGKTPFLSGVVRSFFSGLASTVDDFDITLPRRNTDAGVANAVAWRGNGTVTVDDLRLDGDREKSQQVIRHATMILQGTYDGGTGAQSNKEGGVTRKAGAKGNAIFTAEVPPVSAGTAIMTRMVLLKFDRATITGLGDDQNSPLTAWTRMVEEHDVARQLSALVVQRLARLMDEFGHAAVIDQLRAKRAAWRKQLDADLIEVPSDTGADRVLTIACSGQVGWDLLEDAVAALAGTPLGESLAPQLPSREDRRRALLNVAREALVAVRGESIGAQILGLLRDRMGDKRAYLSPDRKGFTPTALDTRWTDYGWYLDGDHAYLKTTQGSDVIPIGIVSADARFVHIKSSSVKKAAKALGHPVDDESLERAMREFLEPSFLAQRVEARDRYEALTPSQRQKKITPGWSSKPSSKHFDPEAPRTDGYTVSASLLGIESAAEMAENLLEEGVLSNVTPITTKRTAQSGAQSTPAISAETTHQFAQVAGLFVLPTEGSSALAFSTDPDAGF
ncbi:hypothetical protein D3230_09490 [Leucobacter chromiireducens subsp. solipictus]|uniref:Uncharacterized protein n=1 Tax=Leucobacter chromiireducens subsp. solipictus TaxID=398235 RepID=A0ABS1SJP9_9MICO|nr:hypothetical protein [Leucobacter chromiireducens subsp. solipictus]